jgi:penicillin-binding protein 1A
MEKVYADPNSGYAPGPFPKPWTKITKQYDCPSPHIKTDTLSVDSTMIDSTQLKLNEPVEQKTSNENVPSNK